MSAYLGSTKVWEQADANGWVRPSQWLTLPTVSASEQKIVGLHAVWPTGGNFAALTCSGNYTVDWGDGTTENFSSGATAEHEYNYSDTDLNGTLTVYGYKQAVVTITQQSGQSLTSVNLSTKHSGIGSSGIHVPGWLELVVSVPSCTSLKFCTLNATSLTNLVRLKVLSSGSHSSLAELIWSCSNLVIADLQGMTTTTGPSMTRFARYGTSLKALILPSTLTGISGLSVFEGSALTALDLSGLSSFTFNGSDFNACKQLASVALPSTISVSSMTSAFNGCYSLGSLTGPIPETFSITNCRFSASALDALYTSLPTVTGKTIYVKGNYGTTGHTPSIATAKGWTVDTTT